MGHPLVRLAGEIDWGFLDQRFASTCAPGPGQPTPPTRLVAGLFILKHMHNLSDEALRARWVENPYCQHFCGEAVFRHELPFDRSSLTRWRQRLGEEHLAALLQESLAVAHRTGALATKELERVAVDTTVQPKAIAHPTDARLMHRAGRYTHAHQFKRARRALKFLRIQHSADDPALVEEVRSLVEAIVLTPRAGACGLTSRATSQGSSRSLRWRQSKSPPAIFSRAGSSR